MKILYNSVSGCKTCFFIVSHFKVIQLCNISTKLLKKLPLSQVTEEIDYDETVLS